MNESKHTPGPWFQQNDKDSPYITTMSGGRIAYINNRSGSGEQAANACLIAAAPDLLEALQEILDSADSTSVGYDIAVKAIAKAIGE